MYVLCIIGMMYTLTLAPLSMPQQCVVSGNMGIFVR